MKLAAPLVAVFVVVALAESALGILQPRMTATDENWNAAAASVASAPDDLVVFAPAWVDQVGRAHLGARMPVAMVARSDADRYARIWELSVHGAHADEVKGLPVAWEGHFGRVTVRRYDKPAVKVLRDLTEAFADAIVTMTPARSSPPPNGGEAQPCLRDGDARRCGANRVGPRVLEIDYQPRRGILVPVTGGQVTSIAYDGVPGGRLVGYAGLHDYYARKSADGMVMFRVRVDDGKSLSLAIHNEDGWRRFELDLAPGTHTVRFEVESEHPAWRNLGFHAEVRK